MLRLSSCAMGAVVFALVLSVGGCAGPEGGKAPEKKAQAEPKKEVRAAFAAGPAVSREGEKVVITFTATRPTVATVEVLTSDGRVVRHLVSGQLGPKAPPPLAADTLSQKLVWNGLDDRGKPAPAGCSVRVTLGLTLVFDRLIRWEPPGIMGYGVAGLACDPQGRLYVMEGNANTRHFHALDILVFERDGRYVRTIVPSPDRLAPSPGLVEQNDARCLFSEARPAGLYGQRRQTAVVAGDRLFFAGSLSPHVDSRRAGAPGADRRRRHLQALGLDGLPGEDFFGPALPDSTGYGAAPIYLAVTPDRKTVYVAGLRENKGSKPHHVVYRADWNEKDLAPWLGELLKAGGDEAHLNEPRGLALDAKGRVYVCDYGNNRILVLSTDKKVIARIAVPGPEQVCVHPVTGALYVLSVRDARYMDKALVKFASVEEGAGELSKLEMPWRGPGPTIHRPNQHDVGPIMALDASDRDEPRLWVSCVAKYNVGGYLWLIADRGGELKRLPTPIPCYRFPRMPSPCPIVADVARDELYIAGRSLPAILRVDGRTGKVERLEKITADVRTRPDGGKGNVPTDELRVVALDLDSDGLFYVRLMMPYSGWDNWIRRYDRDGNRVPFKTAGDQLKVIQTSHGYHPGGFRVVKDGSIYVMNHSPDTKPRTKESYNVLDVYAPDGTLAKPKFIPFLTCSAWGPRFGPDGSLYLTEAMRPRGMPRPRYGETVGSLLKFKAGASPRLRYGDAASKDAQYELRLYEHKLPPAEVDGLEWAHYGVSPVPFGHCVCPAAAFDVDGYGRAWVPAAAAHSIRVLDAAGNLVAQFGSYGNWDTRGLRAPVSVAVSDDAAYISDRANRRVLRARLTYDAEQKLRVP